MVFRGQIWPKMTKARFQRKHSHIFLFFLPGIQWNSARIWRYSRVFGDKNLKHRGGIHWNTGAFGPRFQWNLHGFQVFTPKNTWNRQKSSPSFTETGQKKKMRGFLLKPSNFKFSASAFVIPPKVLADFHWNQEKKQVYFKNDFEQKLTYHPKSA